MSRAAISILLTVLGLCAGIVLGSHLGLQEARTCYMQLLECASTNQTILDPRDHEINTRLLSWADGERD
jgi:hypothetical protein